MATQCQSTTTLPSIQRGDTPAYPSLLMGTIVALLPFKILPLTYTEIYLAESKYCVFMEVCYIYLDVSRQLGVGNH